mmetsp:Transcript_2314/g.6862  ORF Transcript_2314/g.6862 Transcript_2314/m.6862 type:complete len:589 (+) Transcript_2314:55-1821(+)
MEEQSGHPADPNQFSGREGRGGRHCPRPLGRGRPQRRALRCGQPQRRASGDVLGVLDGLQLVRGRLGLRGGPGPPVGSLLLLPAAQPALEDGPDRPPGQERADVGQNGRHKWQKEDLVEVGYPKGPAQVADEDVGVRGGLGELHEARDVGQQRVQEGDDEGQVRVHEREVRRELLEARDQEVHVGQEPRQVGLVVDLLLDLLWLALVPGALVNDLALLGHPAHAAELRELRRVVPVDLLAPDGRVGHELVEVVQQDAAVLGEDVEVEQDVRQVRLDPVHALHDPVEMRLHLPEVRVQDPHDARDVRPEDVEAGVDGGHVRQDAVRVRQDRPRQRGPHREVLAHVDAGQRLVDQPGPGVLGVGHPGEEDLDGLVGQHLRGEPERPAAELVGAPRQVAALHHVHQGLHDRHGVGVHLDLRDLVGRRAVGLVEDLHEPPGVEHVHDGLRHRALHVPVLVEAATRQEGRVPVDELQRLLARGDDLQPRQHLGHAVLLDEEGRGVRLDHLHALLLRDPQRQHQAGPPPHDLLLRQGLAEEGLLLDGHGVLAADGLPGPRQHLVAHHLHLHHRSEGLLLGLDHRLSGGGPRHGR